MRGKVDFYGNGVMVVADIPNLDLYGWGPSGPNYVRAPLLCHRSCVAQVYSAKAFLYGDPMMPQGLPVRRSRPASRVRALMRGR